MMNIAAQIWGVDDGESCVASLLLTRVLSMMICKTQNLNTKNLSLNGNV